MKRNTLLLLAILIATGALIYNVEPTDYKVKYVVDSNARESVTHLRERLDEMQLQLSTLQLKLDSIESTNKLLNR